MYGELEEIIFILGTFILGDETFALQGDTTDQASAGS
jgi:hypothetical protein